MSREIKFRAWGKTEKEYIRYPFAWLSLFDSPDGLEIEESEDLVIEQYTGLKDKNGKEIYEGDRIKIEGSDTVYTVEYGRGVWVARFGDESGDNICLFHYVQKDMVLYAEVIGNIHENPELLEGEE